MLGRQPVVVGPPSWKAQIREWWWSEYEQEARSMGWSVLDERMRGTASDTVLTRELRRGRITVEEDDTNE